MGKPIYTVFRRIISMKSKTNELTHRVRLAPVALLLVSVVFAAGCVSPPAATGDQVLEDGTIVKSDGTMIKPDGTMIKPNGVMVKPDGTMAAPEGSPEGTMVKEDGTIVKPDGTMVKPDGTMVGPEGSEGDAMMEKTVTGTVLAGSSSPLVDFNKADYDAAVASDKLVVLYFYATWCPICRAEEPELRAAFNDLTGDNVIGFRVNFNDGDTDTDEKALAQQFQVPYQHYKVFLKNGGVVLKAPDTWNKERYLTEINKAAS